MQLTKKELHMLSIWIIRWVGMDRLQLYAGVY